MTNYEELAKKIKGKRELAKSAKELMEQRQKKFETKLQKTYDKYNTKKNRE